MRVVTLLALCCAMAAGQAVPLAQLIAEAEAHNPGVAAAAAAARAAGDAVAPAGALPDPQVMVQQMSVGNPLPFAGYERSNFAFVGVGASQTVPYPGKRRLRAAGAASRAEAARDRVAQLRRALAQQVEATYIELGYQAQARRILAAQQGVLKAIADQAQSRYAAGTGPQADLLQAQLEQSQVLREMAEQREQEEAAQAEMRALLNRPPASPAVRVASLRRTDEPLAAATAAGLGGAPDLAGLRAEARAAAQGVALARKDLRPDFQLQYMYQRTSDRFPDYYQWTVGINLPLHRRSRLAPELAGAAARESEAEANVQAQTRQDQLGLEQARLRADDDARLLDLDQGALLPQIRATAAARLAAYAAGRGTLAEVMGSERDALALQRQYWRTLADHEIALSKITELTGVGHD